MSAVKVEMRICRLLLASLFPLLGLHEAVAQDSNSDLSDSAPANVLPAAYDAYIVQAGDSLFGIAEAFDTTIADLRQINGIAAGETLFAGQTILLPTGVSSFVEVYEIQPGDTLFGLAKRFNTSIGIIQGLNEIDDSTSIQAGQTLIVPSVNEADLLIHVVAPNESLFSISKRYLTTVSTLKSLNGIVDERELIQGASILVPNIDETKFELYEVAAADTLYSISRRFATTEETLISLNGLAGAHDLAAGQSILAPRIDEELYAVYEVKSGDTLFNIARRYNTTVVQLRALNGIGGGRGLNIGRSIIVPRVDETIFETVIVKTGDSLYSIAKRHDVSLSALQALNRLADARDLAVGEAILVPKLENAVLGIHVVRYGDSLASIAAAFETSVRLLQSLNGIANPSLIQVDDFMLVPVPVEQFVRPGFGFGIQVFADGENAASLADQVAELAVDWVKIDVSWAELEPEPGVFRYSALDALVAAFELMDVKTMLNVFDAPDWSRRAYTGKLYSKMRAYGGPPEDLDDFANFLANLVARYAGLVDAYEVWKSPNLLKYWTAPVYHREPELTDEGDYGVPDEVQLGAGYYVPLLKVAYDTIKSYDERALVISGGLAPVGYSDGYNSIDTGTFLQGMLAAGAADSSDAIGAVFSASAVPPTLDCCDKPPGVDSHYESFLQYLPDLLEFYSEALAENGLSDFPLIVTQMGWGTNEGANIAVASSGFEWLNYTSADEQALYVAQAFHIVQKMENVSAMILYNLNGCAVADEEACFFSLVDAAGERRPAFESFRDVPKSKSA